MKHIGPSVLIAFVAASVPAAAQDAASSAARGVASMGSSEHRVAITTRAELERQLVARWGSQRLSKGTVLDPDELAVAVRSAPRGRLAFASAARDADTFNSRLSGAPVTPRFTTGAAFFDQNFVGTTPCRIVDTRLATLGKMAANETRSFRSNSAVVSIADQGADVSGCPEIPFDPPALLMTLTIADAEGNGNARAWPFGVAEPLASNINYRTGVNIANTTGVTTTVNAGPDFSVKTTQAVNVIVDVVGYFRPTDKTVDLQVMDATWQNATLSTGVGMGYSIADNAIGVFRTTLFLPDDYSPDTAMAIRFLFSTGDTGCDMSWQTNDPLRVLSDGSDTSVVLTSTPSSQFITVPAVANTIFETVIDLTVDSAAVSPGDLLTLSWFRSSSGSDTCAGSLTVRGAQFLYQ